MPQEARVGGVGGCWGRLLPSLTLYRVREENRMGRVTGEEGWKRGGVAGVDLVKESVSKTLLVTPPFNTPQMSETNPRHHTTPPHNPYTLG